MSSPAENPPMTLDTIFDPEIVLQPDFLSPHDGEAPLTPAQKATRMRIFGMVISWVVHNGNTDKDLVRNNEGMCMGLTLEALVAFLDTGKYMRIKGMGPVSWKSVQAIIDER